MKTSLLLVVLLLASCALAAPAGDLEASGLGPEETPEELTVFEEDDSESKGRFTYGAECNRNVNGT